MVKFSNDFWKDNPQYVHIKEFANLKKKHKNSDKLANAVFLYCDASSIYAKIPKEERKQEIIEVFLNGEDVFNIPEVKELIDKYTSLTCTPAQAAFALWQEKLMERENFIKQTDYGEDTFEMLDKLMVGTPKIWDMYFKVKKDLEAETAEGQVRGGSSLSLSDQGLI